jgi:hypothetical protein
MQILLSNHQVQSSAKSEVPCWQRSLFVLGTRMEKRPLPRSDTSSVHDRGRVKPVCKTSSETGLEKQIVRILRAELRCNDNEPVVSKWRLGQRGHFEVSHVV